MSLGRLSTIVRHLPFRWNTTLLRPTRITTQLSTGSFRQVHHQIQFSGVTRSIGPCTSRSITQRQITPSCMNATTLKTLTRPYTIKGRQNYRPFTTTANPQTTEVSATTSVVRSVATGTKGKSGAKKPKKRSRLLSALGFTTMFFALGYVMLVIVTTQMNKHAVVGHYSKTALHDETVIVMASAMEQMASLGLLDLKLIADDDVKEIHDDLENTTEDLNLFVMHEKELGGLIGAYRAFRDSHLPSTKALPTAFNPEKDQEARFEFYQRQTLRKCLIQFMKDLEDVTKYAQDGYKANQHMIKMFLTSFVEYNINDDPLVTIMKALNSTPLDAFERTLEIIFLRNNIYPDLYHESLTKTQNEQIDEKGSAAAKAILGSSLPLTRILKNIDNRYVYQVLPVDPKSQYIQHSPFYHELVNIPQHILDHEDRSLTGPLFEYYYNVLCRNQYHNMLVEEINHLRESRDILMQTASFFKLQSPQVMVDGTSAEVLQDPSVAPLAHLAMTSINELTNDVGIHAPLFPIPSHFLASTGIEGKRVDDHQQSDLFTSPSFQNQSFQKQMETLFKRAKKRLTTLIPSLSKQEPSKLIDRYAVTTRYPDSLAHTIDTTSLVNTFGLKDAKNRVWQSLDALPPRYYTMSKSPETDEVCRVLTKIDACIVRNQLELQRLHTHASKSYEESRKLLQASQPSSNLWSTLKIW